MKDRHETGERMEGAKGTGEASAEKQAKLARSKSARQQRATKAAKSRMDRGYSRTVVNFE